MFNDTPLDRARAYAAAEEQAYGGADTIAYHLMLAAERPKSAEGWWDGIADAIRAKLGERAGADFMSNPGAYLSGAWGAAKGSMPEPAQKFLDSYGANVGYGLAGALGAGLLSRATNSRGSQEGEEEYRRRRGSQALVAALAGGAAGGAFGKNIHEGLTGLWGKGKELISGDQASSGGGGRGGAEAPQPEGSYLNSATLGGAAGGAFGWRMDSLSRLRNLEQNRGRISHLGEQIADLQGQRIAATAGVPSRGASLLRRVVGNDMSRAGHRWARTPIIGGVARRLQDSGSSMLARGIDGQGAAARAAETAAPLTARINGLNSEMRAATRGSRFGARSLARIGGWGAAGLGIGSLIGHMSESTGAANPEM